MIRFQQPRDTLSIENDPELWREVYGYMAVCVAEFLDTEDEADLEDHDFSFAVASRLDAEYLRSIGNPEETVTISIQCGSTSRKIHRLAYCTEVIFFDDATAREMGLFTANGSATL